ncbi:tRNA pseudouridine(55) synthase TruB [Pendulispora albinea]|uniref:tRNA pseudouridine synthase B n=1 Tax=Pendulispora albinea TaxID=2741071 RepID=A0ABZ2LKS4_9BACT
MDGVIVIDKPSGLTSHDVVQRLRKRLKTRAIGHAGTLDPMATGVLVVAIGTATKLVPYLTLADKAYEVTVRLGVATDSLDADGEVTDHADVPADFGARLPDAIACELSREEQVPPAVSAIHHGGVRAHELVRQGKSFELAARPVRVRSIELLATVDDPPGFSARLTVAKGYYVRAFARDAAARLDTKGHVTALRRVRSDPFELAEASPPDAPDLERRILSLETAAARALPVAHLTEQGTRDAGCGRAVSKENIAGVASGAVHAWFDPAGRLVALGERREGERHFVVRGFPS